MTMKKSFIYSLAAVFALAACSKEADVKVPTGETVTIIASVDQTRSTESHASFSWVAGEEQISVGTSDEEYVTFDVTNADDGIFQHTFSGETPQLLVAVSPVQENAVFIDATAYEVELPAVYNYYDPSKGVTNALMIGTPDPNVKNKFLFRHAAALVKVTYANVPVGTKSFVFEADANLTGTVTLGGVETSDIEISNSNSELDGSEVWINLPQAVAVRNTTLSFYVPVPTGDYSMLNVYLANAGGKIASTEKTMDRTGKSALHLNRADVFTFPTITLAAEPIVENFTSSKAAADTYDCNSSLSTNANRQDFDFTWTPEGSGTVFKNGIKLGKGTANGSVTSSNILGDIPAGSMFTVKVYAAVWNTDGGELVVSYNGNDLQAAPANDPITSTDSEYSASDFTLPTEFVFMKSADADNLTIASSAKRILIDKVEIVLGGTPVPVQSLTVTPSAENPETVSYEGGVLNYTVTTENIDSWDVTSSNPTDFAPEKTADGFKVTVSANTGLSTRNATITVTGGTKVKTVTINQAAHVPQDVNTIDDPYSALDAISAMNLLADNTPTVDFYYVEGIVDAVPSWYGASSGELTFTFADENNNQIKAFNCLGINGAHFSGKSDLSIGDHVVVYGNLEKYVKDNQTTYEIVNCNLAALTKAPSIIATLSDAPQISYKGGTMTLEIVANVAWTASINNNATLSIGSGTPAASVSGTTNTTVTVSIPENADGQTYTISFTSTSTEVTVPADIQIVQSAAPTLTGIAVEDYTDTYPVSTETYAFDGKVFALFSDNTREEISSGYSITGTVDLTTADEYELTISYQGFEQTITISVITPGSNHYSIVFANNASSPTAIASSTQATTTIGDGRDYVASKPYTVNSGNCYYGDTKTCIRLGKSGAASQLSIALSDAGKKSATSIVVNCKNLGGNKNTGAKISVNGFDGQTTSDTTAADYTFSFSSPTDISSIVLSADKAIYIYSITVNY